MANIPTWYRIRYEFYKQIHEQVLRRLGDEPAEIRSYRKNYEKEFDRSWSVSNREILLKKIQSARLIYLGDFHPLLQSQKVHLRILKNTSVGKNTVLGLECFWQVDQGLLDQFIKGTLSEKDFLKKIEWKKKWGFPWKNYQPMLRWARENKVKVIGLNGPIKSKIKNLNTAGSVGLKTRDQWAADAILKYFSEHPDCKMFVVYGDLHLAERHLPGLVKKKMGKRSPLKTLRVMQNSEKIYFQLLRKEKEDQVDVVALPRETFCLLSVPPWVKWQNYLLDLEQTDDQGLKGSSLDLTDHVSQYVKMICQDLELKVDVSHLSVFTAQDRSLWKSIQENFPIRQVEVLELMIAEERPFFLPQVGIAYLSRMSVNHAAALAMHYIHSRHCKLKAWNLELPRDFQRLIWLEALSYFGSKLINPKRKTETLLDLRKMLDSKSPRDAGKESLRLALAQKMTELSVLTKRDGHRFKFIPKKKSSYLTAATLLGGMMGEKIFTGYRQKILSLSAIQNLLKKDWTSEAFIKSYYAILEIIEPMPTSFKSKSDKL
ncbi:MAG: ChaN family lipoprotein [Bdellovibrionota bacterium]